MERHEQDVSVSSWHLPSEDLRICSGEVHVWREILDVPPAEVHSLESTLVAEELARAARFRFERDRIHYIVGRGQLRSILSRYVNIDPQHLRFRNNSYGKPSLTKETGGVALCFNMTRSHNMALYAIAYKRRLGIDLERLDNDLPVLSMADRIFSPHELKTFLALPLDKRQEAFFTCWTRKEAYVKARGHGLSFDLRQFEVVDSLGKRVTVVSLAMDKRDVSWGTLQDLKPGPGYIGAVAAEGLDWQLICYEPARTRYSM